MASASANIIPAGSITFGGFINGKGQYLRVNGLANVASNGVGTVAVVGTRSRVARVTWQSERNTRHWFRLLRNGEYFANLRFPTPSGVLELDQFYTLNSGDTLQIYCFHDEVQNQFPGPITVTLYMGAR